MAVTGTKSTPTKNPAKVVSGTIISASSFKSMVTILDQLRSHTHTFTDTYATNCNCNCACRGIL